MYIVRRITRSRFEERSELRALSSARFKDRKSLPSARMLLQEALQTLAAAHHGCVALFAERYRKQDWCRAWRQSGRDRAQHRRAGNDV